MLIIVNATSCKYADENGSIECLIELDDGTILPFTATSDDFEPHGRDIHARIVAGEFGAITPYVAPPVPVPASVTKRQAKEALIRQGLHQAALDAIAAIPDPTERALAENYWTESQAFERGNATLIAMATTGLGMTEAQLDDLFRYAETL